MKQHSNWQSKIIDVPRIGYVAEHGSRNRPAKGLLTER
jgi:hypothetical protein